MWIVRISSRKIQNIADPLRLNSRKNVVPRCCQKPHPSDNRDHDNISTTWYAISENFHCKTWVNGGPLIPLSVLGLATLQGTAKIPFLLTSTEQKENGHRLMYKWIFEVFYWERTDVSKNDITVPGRPRHPRIFLPPSCRVTFDWCREFVSTTDHAVQWNAPREGNFSCVAL